MKILKYVLIVLAAMAAGVALAAFTSLDEKFKALVTKKPAALTP